MSLVLLLVLSTFITDWYRLELVKPNELYSSIETADKIIIKKAFPKEVILFESTKKEDILEFKESLTLEKPKQWGYCACMGSPEVVLYKDGKRLLSITNHHGYSIRTDFWNDVGNVSIVDVEKWLSWFDKRGISSLRKEVEDAKARDIQHKKDTEQWLLAMPISIKKVWSDKMKMFGVGEDITPFVELFEEAIPNKEERILKLLHWFGSGAGPWSGFPSYESIAENMLLQYTTSDIVKVAEESNLTAIQTEGLARHFGGWDFSKKRPEGLSKVPIELKKMLWNHVKTTEDEDKLGRAERAFRKD